MKQIITTALLLLPGLYHAQHKLKGKLSFDFGYSFHQYQMTSLNENFIDYYITEIEVLEDRITTGRSVNIGIGFSIYRYIENRINFCYDRGITESITPINLINVQDVEATYHYVARSRAFSLSFGTQFYLNQIDFLKPKSEFSFFNRLHYGPDFNIGYGFGNFTVHGAIPSENIYREFLFKANGMKYQIGFRSEYTFGINSTLVSIGLALGYQLFETSELKHYSGDNLVGFGESTPNLDFSGWYYGIYLKLGK